MAECRNVECRKGYTPGVVASGKGTPNAPVVGAAMRWGWVNCLACNMSEAQKKAGAQFKHVNRSAEEIAERARLADSKSTYTPQAAAPRVNLETVAAKTPTPPPSTSSIASDALVQRLLDQNEKLSSQISELLEDNRALRHRLEDRELPDGTPRIRKIPKKTKRRGVRRNGADSDED